MPPQDAGADIDPATATAEDDEEARLPEMPEEPADTIAEGGLTAGHAAIENAVRLAPTSPGVYRMLNAAHDVLYVGKAKNVKKRLTSYARVNAPLPARILRMIAATTNVEIVSTTTETEALLLEANLIKQLRPRFNVQLRDDKSFHATRTRRCARRSSRGHRPWNSSEAEPLDIRCAGNETRVVPRGVLGGRQFALRGG